MGGDLNDIITTGEYTFIEGNASNYNSNNKNYKYFIIAGISVLLIYLISKNTKQKKKFEV